VAYIARRLAVDTGGTFTDLVVEGTDGLLRTYKSPSTPADPSAGVLAVLETAAASAGTTAERFLAPAEMLIHGTTRAINAILTQNTARTALLTTEGHADVLVFREGGRTGVFDFSRPYPPPYVRRALTFEIPERIGAGGEVVKQLDAVGALETIQELKRSDVEAVAVCLLWSIANPTHELLIAELLEAHLPGVPYTLSHRVNPALREYRRASSASIDASLKPVMTTYLRDLEQRLRGVGFPGRVLVVTSNGGVVDAADVAEAPILSINSGPAMAPVAGRRYAQLESRRDTAIVADTGGTSYDVSLVREGRIPKTRETWIGAPYFGHVTGLPSVDVKSVGAGGGSIARVDEGGLLHVGPDSAGSVPGPVCYGRGGERPTVTDAGLVLGYLDPAYFLAGEMALDVDGARAAIEREIAGPLGLGVDDAAAAIVELATEHMVRAIEDITINQGIDPRGAVLVGGGGAAGLNAVAIARRLGCPEVVIPEVGAVLSAAGALLSDLATEFDRHLATTSSYFDLERANEALEQLEGQCLEFIAGPGSGSTRSTIEFSVEARYPDQAWELEVPLRASRLRDAADVDALCGDFHALHQRVFAISDPRSPIEIVTWRARASCVLRDEKPIRVARPVVDRPPAARLAYFPGHGAVEVPVHHLDAMQPPTRVSGPAILESSFTTVVVDPWASATLKEDGRLAIDPLGSVESAKQPLSSASQPQLR
jgi:N-methylhydantoinase A